MVGSHSSEPAVQVRGLGHSFGDRESRKRVLHEIDLDLLPGEIVLMTGPSGSGKTTLLTLIGALRSAQEGSIRAFGRDLAGLSARELVSIRIGIGFVFQGHNLFESLTARENVHMAVELTVRNARERDRRSAEILTRLGLGDHMTHKPEALSGGQKQRVAVARALVNRPKIILADEPTAALDRDAGREVIHILKGLAQEEQSAVLLVTHDMRILDFADRIVNMVDGRIVSDVAVKKAVLVAEFLRRCPLFADQEPGMLAEFAERMQREAFQPGETIIRQGEAGDRFYVIESGVVDVSGVENGVPFGGISLTTGDFFGEVALLTGEPRNATVTARSPVETFTLSKEHFDEARKRSKSLEVQLREALYRRS